MTKILIAIFVWMGSFAVAAWLSKHGVNVNKSVLTLDNGFKITYQLIGAVGMVMLVFGMKD
jgi:hypothetical protein